MSQLSVRELKFAILDTLRTGAHQHKINLLGRPYPRGDGGLERRLGRTFEAETRALADRAFEELLSADLIRPSYKDLTEPEKWVEITERGREALDRRSLDALDEALHQLDPHLTEMRDGAWLTLKAGTPDALRQAAHSARELISQALRKAAPDKLVTSEPGFVADPSSKSGITRRHRIRFVMRQRCGRVSTSRMRTIEAACALVEATYDALSATAHADFVPQTQDVEDAVRTAEMALRLIFVPG